MRNNARMDDLNVFCISLDRRGDRWPALADRLKQFGLNAERIEALDGRALAAAQGRVSSGLSPGELGCLASHRRAIEAAQRRGLSRVLVLEDDVCFHRRFAERLAEVAAFPDNWDLLYLGASQYDRRGAKFVSPHAYRARKTLGTFAYAMRRPLFDTFLALTERLDLPADVAMTRLQDDPASNCLVCYPALVIADVRQSDIRPPRDPRRHSARVGWRLDDYEMPELAAEGAATAARQTPTNQTGRPSVLLAIDRLGWAFHTDAKGLVKHLSDEFAFEMTRYAELTAGPGGAPPRRPIETDLLVAFWWQSLLDMDTSRAGAVATGLFETWSWDVLGAERLQAALDKADVLLVANQYILDDLRNHPFGFRPPAVFLCEEGVDCDIFTPQPFPQEFAVGWAGTTVNARGYRGQPDGKGLGVIQEAARLADVRLLSARRVDAVRGRATEWQIAHDAMAEQYSTHCVGSYSEGAPLTAGEALACGRPLITTNVGIVPRLVQHGVNGLIVPRDAAAVAAAMLEIQQIGPEKMAAAARRSALLMDWSRQAPKWAHAFRSALELARRRTHAAVAQRPEYASGEWEVRRFGAAVPE